VSRNDHHDYEPGARVDVQIDANGRTRWRAATFIGTRVGVQYNNCTFLVVETRDGRVWSTCAPECVRNPKKE
jgi:hypothetical protein